MAALIIAAPAFAGGGQEGEGGSDALRLSMGGSTTMEPIMTSAMEVYRTELEPAAELSYDAQGSTMGIQGVLNGIFDLGGASRALLPSEKEQGVTSTTVALDGLAVIVNDSVPIDDISIEDLAAIFVGEVGNWRRLGGPDQEIVVVNRDEASGTLGAFRELVLQEVYGDDARFVRRALVTESNGNMATMVTQTPYAIGYASLNTIPRVNESGGKALTVNGVEDNAETVMTGEYPITRPLNLVHYGEPSDEAQVFIDFLLSERGQQVIRQARFLPIGAARQ
jgi:phosphate transport system substrate-binding protein